MSKLYTKAVEEKRVFEINIAYNLKIHQYNSTRHSSAWVCPHFLSQNYEVPKDYLVYKLPCLTLIKLY